MEKEMTLQDFKTNIYKASESCQQVLQQSHDQALEQNDIQSQRWKDYHREHVELSTRLLSLRDDLSHSIMVPLGRRALMCGRLVHTNELLVSLGDGWFAEQSSKQAVDVCQRRIQSSDEMLKKLEKERELLISRKTFSFENDTFGSGQTQEIIEPYEEEEEKKWREQHRQKERDYRQKLADLKKAQPTKIESEEDLWKRLNALDIQEELEDELNRMGEDVESEDYDVSEDEDTESADSDDNDTRLSVQTDEVKKKTLKRRVSFKEDGDGFNFEKETESDEADCDMIRIAFKHSDTPLCVSSDATDEIVCPSDIYSNYVSHRMPKSILKPSQSVDVLSEGLHTSANDKSEIIQHYIEPAIKAISEEVVESKLTTAPVSNIERPVSRFKAARMASKR